MKRGRQDYTKRSNPKRRRVTNEQAVVALVNRQVNRKLELKYADAYSGANAISSSGTSFSLFSALIRGDEALNNFNGNQLLVRNITIDWFAYTNQAYNSMRLVVFQWMDSTAPVLSDILQVTTTGLGTVSAFNVNTKGRMRVLADRKYVLAPTAGDGTTVLGQGTFIGKIHIPGNKCAPVKWVYGAATINSGDIFCLQLSDDSAPTYPATSLYSRISFTD